VTTARTDAPSGTQDPDAPASPPADPARRWKVLTTVLTMALAVTLLLLLVRVPWPGARPADTSPEVGFSRDMLVHHEQAVTMGFLVRDATDDADVDTIALDMIKSQAEQQGMFLGWLRANDVPATTDVPLMAWMVEGGQHGGGHEVDPDAVSPDASPAEQREQLQRAMGMASDEELARLSDLRGEEAEVFFLQLMTRHHQGGVVMAEEFVQRSDDPQLREIADAVLAGQNRELGIMANLLQERGATAEVPAP
jgi:uncharacterized protein (DUF305 family)